MSQKPVDLCTRFIEAVKDEGVASIDYSKLGERLAESNIAEVRPLKILLDKIAQDEQSHKMALEKVAKLICAIR